LPNGFYDYIVSGDVIAFDAETHTSTTASTSTLSWSHAASGDNRIVLVGIAWQETTGLETLDSVTYDGEPMTLISSSSLVQIYALVNPPTGSKTVLATWSGGGAKGVVAGAASFSQVDPETPFALAIAKANANTASATVTFNRTQPNSMFADFLAVNTVPASATATVGGGQTQMWNASAGSVPASTRTTGAASYAKKLTDSVTMSWSLSHSDPWELAVVELLPQGIRLYSDEDGQDCLCQPFAINAAEFQSLQEAVDALPDQGGTLLVPGGTYVLTSTLLIDKSSVTIIGAGQTTRIIPADPVHNPIDLINVSADLFRMSNLLLDGLAEEQDLEDGTSCLVFDGLGVTGRLILNCFLENVVVQGASKSGIRITDMIIFTAINCEAIFNPGDGLRIQGTEPPDGGSTMLSFTNCSMSQNGGIGANIGDVDTGNIGMNFLGCTFENNQGEGYTLADIGTAVNAVQCAKLSLYSCYFEEGPEGCEQLVFFNTSPNGVVDNCWFAGHDVPKRAVFFATSSFSRFTSNSAEGFVDEIVRFDTNCLNCVEFANRDFDSGTIPRIVVDANATVIGMSRSALSIPRVLADTDRPTGSEVKVGSMVWVMTPGGSNSKLQAWDGSAWKNIALT
jgi:hypothetical protein